MLPDGIYMKIKLFLRLPHHLGRNCLCGSSLYYGAAESPATGGGTHRLPRRLIERPPVVLRPAERLSRNGF